MEQIVILGAGPAGLAAAYELAVHGKKVVILEKELQVGGISKTVVYNDYRFDLGGHRFFTKIGRVETLWNDMLGDEFLLRPRLSRIYYKGKFYNYPIQATNALRNLGLIEAILIMCSYAHSWMFPISPEESFEDWVSNRFGKRLYGHFFKIYTEKVWGIPCTQLKAEWAAQRIKGLSLMTALKSALWGNKRKSDIKTLIDEFRYPRFGPGMMYEAMENKIIEAGGIILKGADVLALHMSGDRVSSVTAIIDGIEKNFSSTSVISSLPLKTMIRLMQPVVERSITDHFDKLKYRDFLCVNIALSKDRLFADNWIYVHSPEVKLGRVQNFKQWSADAVPEAGCSSLGLEYFCNQGDTLWSMEDYALISLAVQEAASIGLIDAETVKWGMVVRVPKAYPVYDDDYAQAMPFIRGIMARYDNLQTIGRNGLHRYNNMDHSILTGLLAADNLIYGQKNDVWFVNTEAEYSEEQSATRSEFQKV